MKTYYSGEDTYGKHIEVATNNGINYFYRVYGFNGYGMGWSKWQSMEHDKRDLIQDADNRDCYKWGFNKLLKIGDHKFKLPTV